MQSKATRHIVLFSNLLIGLAFSSKSLADETKITLPALTVTGELLSRTVQESGNSVVILDESTLDNLPELRTIRDVFNQTPNVTDQTGTGKLPTVRGIDGTGPAENAFAFIGSTTARLNWQIDGRSASFNEIAYGDYGIWDLSRIELLRGPQSTLTGRNAIAGTLRIETNDPTFEQEGAIRLEGGNYQHRRGSFMFNQPLSETVSVRIAGDKFQRDSVVDFEDYAEANDPGRIEGQNLRAKVLYDPHNDRETRLLLSFTNNQFKSPNSERVYRPYDQRRPQTALQPVHDTESNSIGFEFSQFVAKAIKLEVTASATEIEFERKNNNTPATLDRDELEFEPRLRFSGESGNEWVLGMRLFRARQDDTLNIGIAHNYDDKTDGQAIYIEGITPFAERFELITGLRYEREKRQRVGGELFGPFTLQIDLDKTYDALLPKLGVSYYTDDDHVYGVLLSRGYNAGGANVTLGFPAVSYEYDDESVQTIELFGRQTWLGGRLATTQNLFYSHYDDLQLPIDRTPEVGSDEDYIIENIKGVRTLGAELGANWQINHQWNVFANLGLLHSKITQIDEAGLKGNALPNAPTASLQTGVAWHKGPWQLNLNGRVTSGWYSQVDNRSSNKTNGFATFNASASYQVTKQAKLYIAARNLFDNESPIALFSGATRDTDVAVLTQPRTITAGASFQF